MQGLLGLGEPVRTKQSLVLADVSFCPSQLSLSKLEHGSDTQSHLHVRWNQSEQRSPCGEDLPFWGISSLIVLILVCTFSHNKNVYYKQLKLIRLRNIYHRKRIMLITGVKFLLFSTTKQCTEL